MWTPKQYLLLVLLNLLLKARSDPLLVSLRNGIWLLDGNQTSSVVSSDLPVVTFDIHQAWRQLYWATQHSIYRTPLYDHNTTTLVAVVGQVGSLAVDWAHNHIYWSDLSASRIEAARLDGRGRRIVYEGEWHIGSLALDPELGKLFWIESNQEDGKDKFVKSSNFDGSHVKTLYNDENIYGESPLTLDLVYNSLYFYKVNGSHSEQWEISYNGIMAAIKLFEREEAPVRSLSLTENGFYYCNEDGIFEANWVKKMITLVFGGRVETVTVLDPYIRAVPETLKGVNHLRVLSETGTLRSRDECSYQQCQQECVPITWRTRTTKCLCQYGYSLNGDNRTCSGYGYLFYSTSNTFGRLNLEGKQHTVLFNDPYSEIQTFDVHLKTGYVYWSDMFSQTIYRAPVELPIKKEVVVPKVSAYGVAVDWLHDLLYLTDFNRILVSTLSGDQTLVLLKDLDAPAEIVVDPVNRYIFWADCGSSLSIQRAGLDGSDVTTVVSHVTCGTSITVDPKSRTLYLRYWTGSVYTYGYDGSNETLLLREMVGAMTILDQQLLWTSSQMQTVGTNGSSSHTQLSFLGQVVQPAALKVIQSSQQTGVVDKCVDSDCPGLCLLSPNQTVPALCVCTDHGHNAVSCSHAHNSSTRNEGHTHTRGYLELVDSGPFSVTLRCAGALLTHPVMMPYLQVAEVDSLVARDHVTRMSRQVRVTNKTLPFTIDRLNPASSYKVSLRNRVTRASVSLTVHTAPPPLAVRRLSLVTVPGLNKTVSWLQQGVHYSSPNAWEQLLRREHLLLLVSEKQHSQADSPTVPEPLLQVVQKKVKRNFVVLSHYKTEEEFDDDPEMYLGNIPWGEEFWLAMVQVTQYKQIYNLDVVYSKSFGLPDPYWDFLLGKILEDQREEDD